jgi:gamma-glutamyltranspeptidase/glutathione hydrolase
MPGLFVPTIVRGSRVFAALLLILASAVLPATPCSAASRGAVRGASAMAVTPEDQATRVAVDVLRAGGNAVDAAVATAFALAVTLPYAGNLGGGGFLLYRAPDGAFAALDFRETAPRELRPELFLDEDGRPLPDKSLRSGLAVGVPGTVAGLFDAHRRWGRLPWGDLVAPAILLAEEGVFVSPSLAGVFERAGAPLREQSAARAIFAAHGKLPVEGQRLVQHDLATSLRRIATHGVDGFSLGATAEALERAVHGAGGVLDRADLAGYRPVLRSPVEAPYRGYRVVSFPPPSSGGLMLLQMLGMLERFDLRASGSGSSQSVHVVTEVARRTYADRSRWLGDPEFSSVPSEGLLDPAYLARRSASIDLDRATPSEQMVAGVPPRPEPDETLHFSVSDSSGGAIALTTTLNTAFGCAIVADGTGILLNNQIDDFALAPGVPNQWGLLGSDANAVAGGKRPLSSMTPTIVELPRGGPRPLLVVGSPGGAKIITSVLQVLINVIDHEMPLQDAVDYPRFHHQWLPDVVRHEARAFPEDVRRALLARGHRLERAPRFLGNVNAIGIDGEGRWLGAADPRREGTARGF